MTQILISKTFVKRKLITSFPFAERARLNKVCMKMAEEKYLKEIFREGGKIKRRKYRKREGNKRGEGRHE